MKKRIFFISIIATCVVITVLFIFAQAFCDDDDPVFDTLCVNDCAVYCYRLFEDVLVPVGTAHEYAGALGSFTPIIGYLAQREKSPPAFIA